MDELILRSLRGETSLEEERELDEWRRRSSENERKYRQIARLWELRDVLRARLHAASPPGAATLLKGSRPQRTAGPSVPSAGRDTRRVRESWLARSTRDLLRREWVPVTAAGLAALAVGVGIWRLESVTARSRESVRQTIQVVTERGEASTVRFEDGTIVRLAPESNLRAPLWTRRAREVWLSGRAYFAVVPDEDRPLRVRTPGGEVLVRGTRFDLQASGGELRVTVVDGRVELPSDKGPVSLGPRQMARVRTGQEPEVELVENVHELLDWVGDFVAFESTPLSEVAREIEERYGLQVEIEDPSLASRTVTSWSANKSATEILTAICWAVEAHCVFNDSVASIQP